MWCSRDDDDGGGGGDSDDDGDDEKDRCGGHVVTGCKCLVGGLSSFAFTSSVFLLYLYDNYICIVFVFVFVCLSSA